MTPRISEIIRGILITERSSFNRFPLLRRAYERWLKDGHTAAEAREKLWSETVEYSFYMAVKNHYKGKSWTEWDEDIRLQKREAMEQLQYELADEAGFYAFLQMKFEEQWSALKSYANEKGIRIIGDIPIYVAFGQRGYVVPSGAVSVR